MDTAAVPQPDIAAVAAHVADRSRARILLELVDGSARPASHLAAMAGVSASTASGHLSRLVGAGMLTVETEGRTRRFRLADERVVVLIEALIPLAATDRPTGLRAHTRFERLRVARSCYDHLAGTLGTDVLAGLLERGALVRTDGVDGIARGRDDRLSAAAGSAPYRVGAAGEAMLAEIGVDLAALDRAARPTIRACTDWTEQRHHLAGGLGAAVMTAFVEKEWVRRRGPGRRDLEVSAPDAIAAWLGVGAEGQHTSV